MTSRFHADSNRRAACEAERSLRHEVAFGTAWRSNPDQALRVSAGTPRKHASDGLSRGRGYCQEYEAFPVM